MALRAFHTNYIRGLSLGEAASCPVDRGSLLRGAKKVQPWPAPAPAQGAAGPSTCANQSCKSSTMASRQPLAHARTSRSCFPY